MCCHLAYVIHQQVICNGFRWTSLVNSLTITILLLKITCVGKQTFDALAKINDAGLKLKSKK